MFGGLAKPFKLMYSSARFENVSLFGVVKLRWEFGGMGPGVCTQAIQLILSVISYE